jgi:hypothetical protein
MTKNNRKRIEHCLIDFTLPVDNIPPGETTHTLSQGSRSSIFIPHFLHTSPPSQPASSHLYSLLFPFSSSSSSQPRQIVPKSHQSFQPPPSTLPPSSLPGQHHRLRHPTQSLPQNISTCFLMAPSIFPLLLDSNQATTKATKMSTRTHHLKISLRKKLLISKSSDPRKCPTMRDSMLKHFGLKIFP